jgi:PAS domain S-box-containing protein
MLVQNVQDYAIFMLDPEGPVISWNEGAQRIKGYTAEEIIGRHFSCFYSPEDIAIGKPPRELTEARETGRCEDEGWRIRKDGSRFWANVVITALFGLNGEIKGFSKITRDVTERQLAEERFRGLLESAPDAMLLVGNDGRIVLANARTTKLLATAGGNYSTSRSRSSCQNASAGAIQSIAMAILFRPSHGLWASGLISRGSERTVPNSPPRLASVQ